MELRKNGRNLCALTQELPSIALQRDEEIVNCSIDISTKLTSMALDVLRVRAIHADMYTGPKCIGDTSDLPDNAGGHSNTCVSYCLPQSYLPFSAGPLRRAVVRNQPESLYEFFVPCLPIKEL